MSEKDFYKTLREETDELWQSVFAHPFVKGIGDGSLSKDRYEFFLKQDYVYLIEFSRVFALAAAKAKKLESMGLFATLLDATLNTEMALHRKTCREFGIDEEELEKTEPAMVTTAYTNLLLRTCYEGAMMDILAVLLPCAVGYAEIGQKLKSAGMPDDPFYKDWIHTYTSGEYVEFTDWLVAQMDISSEGAPAAVRENLKRLYVSSARFEYLFFEMSWNMEMWPGNL
jgi:thiaminase/transcriptional activator TenA